MKTAVRFFALYCLLFLPQFVCFSQQNTKLRPSAIKPVFSMDMLWMIGVIVALLLLIILMPKKIKRTTVYVKDEDGNIKAMTHTVIRGKKIDTV